MSDRTGETAIEIVEVLTRAWVDPFTTKSDFSREHANVVAMAASDGFLTTKIATGLYSQHWKVTPRGLAHLFALNGMEGDLGSL